MAEVAIRKKQAKAKTKCQQVAESRTRGEHGRWVKTRCRKIDCMANKAKVEKYGVMIDNLGNQLERCYKLNKDTQNELDKANEKIREMRNLAIFLSFVCVVLIGFCLFAIYA